jgi:hypothetical protein
MSVRSIRIRRLASRACLASLLGLSASAALGAARPTPAFAQSDADRATARQLGLEGQQALDAKEFKTAEDRFRRAEKLVHAPTLLLGLARGLAGEGRYVEAQEAYNRILREGVAPGAPDAFKRALDDARTEVGAVSPKIGGVTITVKAAGGGEIAEPKVTLDDHPLNSASLGVRRAVDPGQHVLKVAAEGYRPAEASFSVPEGGSVDQPVTLEKDPSYVPPQPPAPGGAGGPAQTPGVTGPAGPEHAATTSTKMPAYAPWIAFGIGGVGLAVGSIAGLVAMGKHSDLSKSCQNAVCDSSHQGDVNSYHSVASVATIGFVVAGLGAAGGVVLLLMQSGGDAHAAAAEPPGRYVAPVLGLGTIGARGRF